MNNFRDSSRRDFGGRDSRRPMLHDAVCDECGKSCQVPFRPSGDKPIYCSECFEKRGGRDNDRSNRRTPYRRNFGGRDSGSRSSQSNMSDRGISRLIEKIEASNAKLDIIIKLLSPAKKSNQKPVKNKAKKTKKNKKSKKK